MPELNFNYDGHLNDMDYYINGIIRLGPFYLIVLAISTIFYLYHKQLNYGNFKSNLSNTSFLNYWWIFLFPIFIRTGLAFLFVDNVDLVNSIFTAELTYSGELIYLDYKDKFPYLPFYLPILWLCKYFSVLLSLPLYFTIKWPLIFVDILMIYLIKKVLEYNRTYSDVRILFIYSPLIILNSSVLAQIDMIPVFFCFWAYYVLDRYPEKWKLSAFILGLGIFAKTFPILLLPAFLISFKSFYKQILFALIAIAPSLLSIAFISIFALKQLIENVILYRGVPGGGSWGIPGLIWVIDTVLINFFQISKFEKLWNYFIDYGDWFMYLFIIMSYFIYFKKISLNNRIIITFFAFYAFSNTVTPNYTVWIIPFLLLSDFRRYAPGFLFFATIWTGIFVPVFQTDIFHLDKLRFAYPLVGAALWFYIIYCLIIIFRNISLKSNSLSLLD